MTSCGMVSNSKARSPDSILFASRKVLAVTSHKVRDAALSARNISFTLVLHSRTARANPDATSGALKTVSYVGSWAEGSIPEDIEAAYDTRRYLDEVTLWTSRVKFSSPS